MLISTMTAKLVTTNIIPKAKDCPRLEEDEDLIFYYLIVRQQDDLL